MGSQTHELQVSLPGIPAPEPKDKWERLVQVFADKGTDPDKLAVMLDAILRARQEDARLQFEAAFGRFKDNLPAIFKTKKVTYVNKDGSETKYSHPELEEMTEIIGESLKAYGLTHSWRPTEGENGRVVMTCVFRHPDSGHVQDMATIGSPPDTSGGKNSVQAIGSSLTYLQRYSLLAACGIAPKGLDNDGRTAEGMPEDAITDYAIKMRDQDDMPELKAVFAECYSKARKLSDKSAQDRLIKVYEEKKRSLLAEKRGQQ